MYLEEKIVPQPPVIDNPVVTVLRDAANLLRERGWAQGTYYRGGGYCLLGAIRMARFGGLIISDHDDLLYRSVMDAVGSRIHRDIPDWNDVPGRTKEEVILLLETAAKSVAMQGNG